MQPSAYQVMNQLALAIRDKGIKSSYQSTQLLEDFGYRSLGSGCYGFVIQHPFKDDRVLKVSLKKTYDKDGWIAYALYCMKNAGKHLLRVYAMKTYDTCTIAEIERLESNCNHTAREKYRNRREVIQNLIDGGHMNDEDGSLAKMVQTLGPTADLHDDNWMLRPSGEIVIIDPYADLTSEVYAVENFKLDDGRIDVTIEKIKEPVNGLAVYCKELAVRAAQEGAMLLNRSVLHDIPRHKRISRVVFPVRPADPGKVSSARTAVDCGAKYDPRHPRQVDADLRRKDAARRGHRVFAYGFEMAPIGGLKLQPMDKVWIHGKHLAPPDMPPLAYPIGEATRGALAFYRPEHKAEVPAKIGEP